MYADTNCARKYVRMANISTPDNSLVHDDDGTNATGRIMGTEHHTH